MYKNIILFLVGIMLLGACVSGGESVKKQAEMQYTDEVKSSYRRVLNFSSFQPELSTEREKQIDSLVLSNPFIVVQQAINNNELTVEELLLYYVGRIKRLNPSVNTVLELNPLAMQQAKAMDEALSKGINKGTLHGAIVLVKDNIAVKELHTAAGSYALRDLTTSSDAFVVTTLKEAGAIILGKANLSEWSNFISQPSSSGFSVLGGQTKNPYGPFDVGGSSSGSSVSASLRLASFTLGSETMGSLIHPAGQNSVVALKPTLAMISRDLIIPISAALDTAGVITTNVSDLKLAQTALLAYDSRDPLSDEAAITKMKSQLQNLKLDKNILRGKRLGLYDDGSDEIKAIVQDLENLGAEIIPLSINVEAVYSSMPLLSLLDYGIVNDVADFLARPEVTTSMNSLEDIVNFNAQDPDTRAPYGWLLHRHALNQKITKEKYQNAVSKARTTSRNTLDTLFEDQKIVAIVSRGNLLSGIYAPAGYPALTVPSGYKETGEPYGITFVGKAYGDADLIQFAYAYEQATQYRKNPTTPLWMNTQ